MRDRPFTLAVLASLALAGALGLAGCEPSAQPGARPAGPAASASAPSAAPAPAVVASPPSPAPAPVHRASPAPARDEGLDRGDPAPDFTLPVLGGKKKGRVRLADIAGPEAKPGGPEGVVVAFVASWCGRCAESLPTLASLEKEHAPRLKLVLLAIDEQPDARVVEAEKVAAAGIRGPVLDGLAEPGVLDAWMGSRRNIPRFYLLDRRGTVRVRDTGFGKKMARLLPQQVDWLLNRADQVPAARKGGEAAEAESVDPALGG